MSSVDPAADTGDKPLFPTDTGALPLDTRRALCKLLSGPFIDLDSPHWTAVLRDEAVLRSRLTELFLELVLDRDRKVAFTRQADVGELDAPVLLRSSALTFIDSVMVLHLRQLLMEADGMDQRAVVEVAELRNYLEAYALANGKDAVLAAKRIGASMEKMKKNNILQAIRGTDERFEITPTLRLLFTADDVQALGARYRGIADGQALPAGVEEDTDG